MDNREPGQSETLAALLKKIENTNAVAEQPPQLPPPSSPPGYYGATAGYYGAATAGGDGRNLRHYWNAVRRRLWLVILLAAVMTTLAAIYISRVPNVYQANSVVQVNLENFQSGLGNPKGSSIVVSNPVNDPAYFNTQLRIISSAGVLRRVTKTMDLENNKTFLQPRNDSSFGWNSFLNLLGLGKKEKPAEQPSKPGTLPSSLVDDENANAREDFAEINRLSPYVAALRNMTEIKNVQGTRLIEVVVSHTDKEMSAKIANAVADTFVSMNLEKKTESGATTGDFLQKRIAELQSRIRSGEEKLLNYGKSNQILSLNPDQNTVVDRLTSLNKELIEAENELAKADAAYRVAAQPKAADALAEGEKNTSEMESRLNQLREKRAALSARYTPEYPELKAVEEQITTLEKSIKEARTRATSVTVTNLETRYRQALERERAARTAFESQRRETLTQNEAAINYRIIQQEIEINKSLLNNLLQESKSNEVQTAGIQNNIYVADYATVPREPISPKRGQFVLITLFVSITLGIVLALALEYLNDKVTTISDVENIVRLPALAVIPGFISGKNRRLLPTFASFKSKNGQSRSLIKKEDSNSVTAESYRQLRTSLLLSTAGGAPKSLLVTSSIPGEGKSTTCSNLAATLSQSGAKVLVIDADLRRPQLHKIFEMKNQTGLSSILSQEMDAAEISDLINLHEETNTYVLTSGPRPPNPSELISSEQMCRLLKILKKDFTHIVIDSPPILSFTDGLLIAALVDGVLVVVQSGQSSHSIILQSKRLLESIGAKVLGVVLNKVNLRRSGGYYYNYNEKYYKPDEEEETKEPTLSIFK